MAEGFKPGMGIPDLNPTTHKVYAINSAFSLLLIFLHDLDRMPNRSCKYHP
jgi:hypothetical protein